MIKKIILKIRLLFAKKYVAIDMGDKDDYTSECVMKRVGNNLYLIKTKVYKN